MTEEPNKTTNVDEVPASLRRPKKEPEQAIQIRIAVSQWRELKTLASDYDQTVSAFIREAIGDWLRRARKARKGSTSQKSNPIYPGVSE